MYVCFWIVKNILISNTNIRERGEMVDLFRFEARLRIIFARWRAYSQRDPSAFKCRPSLYNYKIVFRIIYKLISRGLTRFK